MEHAPSKARQDVNCPRCGYDLRGAIETWKNFSPLGGTCAECGLEFDWAELLSSKIRKPRWNVEYTRSIIVFPITTLATMAMSFRPARFWSSMKMTHVFRPRRVIAYLLLPLLTLYLVFAISQGLATRNQINTLAIQTGTVFSPSPAWMIAKSMLLPLSNRLTGTAIVPIPTNGRFRFISGINHVSSNTSNGTVTMSLGPPLKQAARTLRYQKNVSFWDTWSELLIGTKYNRSFRFHWKLLILCVFMATIHALLCPLGFLLLPMSRRRAKVRWSHIVRILLYSLVFEVMFFFIIVIMVMYRMYVGGFDRHLFLLSRWASLLLIPLGMVVWWSCATKHYLKIPHGWAVGLSLGLIAYLMGPVLLFCVEVSLHSWFG
ncbi:MAG: hypothetical protein O7G85_03020 [Planctomycetota bacterium]|nr:hypothetical protein [Planctomycetota bacterium]